MALNTGEKSLQLLNVTKSTEIAGRILIARGFFQRGKGLMFDRELPQGTGLIIDPCSSIHMFFMRFPLDVLYVSGDHQVMRVQKGIRPWRIGPIRTPGTRYIVELPVGTIEVSRTTVGDQLNQAETG